MNVSSLKTETKLPRDTSRLGSMEPSFLLLGIWVLVLAHSAGAQDAPPTQPSVESRFRQALDRPLIASRGRVPVRDMLFRLAGERNVAVLLDRRLDPGRFINVSLNSPTFDDGLREIAALSRGDVSVVADTVFVAPSECARFLRTRIHLIDSHRDGLSGMSVGRKFELVRRFPVRWERLAAPRDILEQICGRWQIVIENPEAIEHDAWEAGVIAHANATEALMLVATQFQLEVEWLTPQSVRFVPESENPAIERTHRPQGMTLDEAQRRIEQGLFDVVAQVRGNTIVALGTVEGHERLAVLLGEKGPRTAQGNPPQTPLSQRRFTLRIEGVAILGLLQELRKQGIDVDFDPEQLTAGGADLSTKISLDLKQVTIQELLRQACTPGKIAFEIDDQRILLKPASD